MRSAYKRSADILQFDMYCYTRRMPAARRRYIDLRLAVEAYLREEKQHERLSLKPSERREFDEACSALSERVAVMGEWFKLQAHESKGIADIYGERKRDELQRAARIMATEYFPALPEQLRVLMVECNTFLWHVKFLDEYTPYGSRALLIPALK